MGILRDVLHQTSIPAQWVHSGWADDITLAQDMAGIRGFQCQQQPEQRRFPCAGTAYQPDAFLRIQIQVGGFQSVRL
ncbi:hypothetical protein D3C75_919830 [compost metagenome]